MIKHTPGPWLMKRHGVIVGGVSRQYINGAAQDQLFMANTVQEENGGTAAQMANARLAAAAPDMLDLLQELIDIEGPQPGTSGWAGRVQAVINKATGDGQ